MAMHLHFPLLNRQSTNYSQGRDRVQREGREGGEEGGGGRRGWEGQNAKGGEGRWREGVGEGEEGMGGTESKGRGGDYYEVMIICCHQGGEGRG